MVAEIPRLELHLQTLLLGGPACLLGHGVGEVHPLDVPAVAGQGEALSPRVGIASKDDRALRVVRIDAQPASYTQLTLATLHPC